MMTFVDISRAGLTERQARFVWHYLEGEPAIRYRANRAARAAGYACPNSQGSRLLTFPRVAAAIETRFRELEPEAAKYR